MVTSRLSPSRSGWRQVRPHNQTVGRARPGQWFRASECRVPKSTQQRNVLVRRYRYHIENMNSYSGLGALLEMPEPLGMRKRGACRQSGLTDIPLPFTRTLPRGPRSMPTPVLTSSPDADVATFGRPSLSSRMTRNTRGINSAPGSRTVSLYYRERPAVAGRSRTMIASMH